MSEHGKIILDTKPANPTRFKRGTRGYLHSPENGLVIVGENDTHVFAILDRGCDYYGVLKNPDNLKELHVTGE